MVVVLEGCSAEEEGVVQALALLLRRWLSTAVGAGPADPVQSQLPPVGIAGAAWGRVLVNLGRVMEEDLCMSLQSLLLSDHSRKAAMGSAFPTGAGAAPCPRGTTGDAPTEPLCPNAWIWLKLISSILAAPGAGPTFAQRPPVSSASSAASQCHAEPAGTACFEAIFRNLLRFRKICVFNAS